MTSIEESKQSSFGLGGMHLIVPSVSVLARCEPRAPPPPPPPPPHKQQPALSTSHKNTQKHLQHSIKQKSTQILPFSSLLFTDSSACDTHIYPSLPSSLQPHAPLHSPHPPVTTRDSRTSGTIHNKRSSLQLKHQRVSHDDMSTGSPASALHIMSLKPELLLRSGSARRRGPVSRSAECSAQAENNSIKRPQTARPASERQHVNTNFQGQTISQTPSFITPAASVQSSSESKSSGAVNESVPLESARHLRDIHNELELSASHALKSELDVEIIRQQFDALNRAHAVLLESSGALESRVHVLEADKQAMATALTQEQIVATARQRDIHVLQGEHDHLHNEYEQLKMKWSELHDEIEDVRAQHEQYIVEQNKLMDEKLQLETANTLLSSQLSSSVAQCSELEGVSGSLRSQLSECRIECEALDSKLSALQHHHHALTQQHHTLQADHQTLQQQHQQLLDQFTTLQSHASTTQNLLTSAQSRGDEQQQLIERLQYKLTNAEQQLHQSETSMKNSHIQQDQLKDELLGRIKRMDHEYSELLVTSQNNEQMRNEYRSQLHLVSAAHAATTSTLDALKSQHSALVNSHSACQNELINVKQHDELQTRMVEKLQSKLKECNMEMQGYIDQLQLIRSINEQLNGKYEKEVEKHMILKSQHSRLHVSRDKEASEYRVKSEHFSRVENSYKSQVHQLQARVNDLRDDSHSSASRIRSLENEVRSAQRSTNNFTNKLLKVQNKLQEALRAHANCAQHQQQAEHIRRALTTAEVSLNKLQNRYNDSLNANALLQDKYERQQLLLHESRLKADNFESKFKVLQNAQKELIDKYDAIKQKLQGAQKEFEKEKQCRVSKEDEINSFQNEKNALERQFRASKLEEKVHLNEIQALQVQIGELRLCVKEEQNKVQMHSERINDLVRDAQASSSRMQSLRESHDLLSTTLDREVSERAELQQQLHETKQQQQLFKQQHQQHMQQILAEQSQHMILKHLQENADRNARIVEFEQQIASLNSHVNDLQQQLHSSTTLLERAESQLRSLRSDSEYVDDHWRVEVSKWRGEYESIESDYKRLKLLEESYERHAATRDDTEKRMQQLEHTNSELTSKIRAIYAEHNAAQLSLLTALSPRLHLSGQNLSSFIITMEQQFTQLQKTHAQCSEDKEIITKNYEKQLKELQQHLQNTIDEYEGELSKSSRKHESDLHIARQSLVRYQWLQQEAYNFLQQLKLNVGWTVQSSASAHATPAATSAQFNFSPSSAVNTTSSNSTTLSIFHAALQEESEVGLLVTAVEQHSAAQLADIRVNDRLLCLNGVCLSHVHDLVVALSVAQQQLSEPLRLIFARRSHAQTDKQHNNSSSTHIQIMYTLIDTRKALNINSEQLTLLRAFSHAPLNPLHAEQQQLECQALLSELAHISPPSDTHMRRRSMINGAMFGGF